MKVSDMTEAGNEFEKWQKNLPLGILSPSEYHDFRRTYLAGFYRAIALAGEKDE